MEKINIEQVYKKCLVCGRTYKNNTKRKVCTCVARGYLYQAGAYYQRKIGGDASAGQEAGHEAE